MKIALFLKPELEESDIATFLISKMSEHDFDLDQENPDVVMFVGGDGTLLRAVQTYINDIPHIKFVGINEGSLGFYAGYDIDQIDELLNDLENNSYTLRKNSLIKATFGEKTIYAVNEIRIENPFHTLIADVSINNEFLETFRGNGLVVASSNGSSAYNKSLGGAIVVPELNTLQLTKIAPINNRVYSSINSSIVMPGSYKIQFACTNTELVVGYDYLTISTKIETIEISNSDLKLEIIYPGDHSFVNHYRGAFINDD